MKGIDWWGTLGAVVGILVALLIAGILYLLITSLPARAAEAVARGTRYLQSLRGVL